MNSLHMQLWGRVDDPQVLINLASWLHRSPVGVEIEVSTVCDLRCIMCERTYWNEPSRKMSLNHFKGIINQLPRLKWFAATGIGENFLNKHFLDMYRYLVEKHPGVLIELYDTFHLIDEKIADALINEIGLSQVFVSLDAATKETYESIRVGSDFDRVIENVRRFIEIRNKSDSGLPRVGFHFIVMKSNIHEMPQFVHLAYELGGDHVFFTRLLHPFKEIGNLYVDIPQQTIDDINALGNELGIRIDWNKDTSANKPPISRCMEHLTPFVFVTGDVQPCCALQEGNDRERLLKLSLGNVFEQPFKEIWTGERYRELRRQIRNNEVPEICHDCPIYETGKGAE